MQHVVGIIDHRINLDIVLLHVQLREFKKLTLSLLHQFINILCRIESLLLYATRVANQIACRRFLRDDASMIFNMRRRNHPLRQLCQVNRATRFFKVIGLSQLLADGEQVEWLLFNIQSANGLKNQSVARIVEGFRLKNLTDLRIGVLFQQQGAEHHALEVQFLWLQTAKCVLRGDIHFLAPRRTGGRLWHNNRKGYRSD